MGLTKFICRYLTLLSVAVVLLAAPGRTFQRSFPLRSSTTRVFGGLEFLDDDTVGQEKMIDTVAPPTSNNDDVRREFISKSMGFLTSVSVVGSANADPSIISSVQGPIQDIFAPGHWIGQFVGINSKTVQWTFPNASPEEVSNALIGVLNDLTPEQKSKLYMPNFDISRADRDKVHVRTWTKNEWLDSLDVSFSQKSTTTIAKASFYATGFFPTSIPGAPIWNVGMAWMPFASPGPRGEMLQDFRLRVLESFVSKRLQNNGNA